MISLKGSINLSKIPKEKIIEGKKGQWLPIDIYIGDDVDEWGNNGNVSVGQEREEWEAKKPKVYLGNIKVTYVKGDMPPKPEYEKESQGQKVVQAADDDDDILPF